MAKGQDLGPGIYLGNTLHEAKNWADGAKGKAEVYFECLVSVGVIKNVPKQPLFCGHEHDDWQEQAQYGSIYAFNQWAIRSDSQIVMYSLKEFGNYQDGSKNERNESSKNFIWRDIHGKTGENNATWELLCKKYKDRIGMSFAADDASALSTIDKIPNKSMVFVATNRSGGGAEFLQQVRARGVSTPALVYCMCTSGWVPMTNVEISVDGGSLGRFVENRIL
jgi:hypothetical protein